jgi:hypothetical protein
VTALVQRYLVQRYLVQRYLAMTHLLAARLPASLTLPSLGQDHATANRFVLQTCCQKRARNASQNRRWCYGPVF